MFIKYHITERNYVFNDKEVSLRQDFELDGSPDYPNHA